VVQPSGNGLVSGLLAGYDMVDDDDEGPRK